MAKKQVYVAAVTKEGISEAIFKEYFDKNPEARKDWEKQIMREDPRCSIEELSGAKVDKEVERYGKWLEKEAKRKAKERAALEIKKGKNPEVKGESYAGDKGKIEAMKKGVEEAKKEAKKEESSTKKPKKAAKKKASKKK